MGKRRSCTFTCWRSWRANADDEGLSGRGRCCRLTAWAEEVVDSPPPQHVYCRGCGRTMCVDCLEQAANELQKTQHSWGPSLELVPHEVYETFLRRGWRSDAPASDALLRRSGLSCCAEWRSECPFCVHVALARPVPPAVTTVDGEPYAGTSPKVLFR